MAADTEYPQSDSNLPVVVDQSSDSKVIAFVREHPVATIAGAAVVGVIVSALLPRREITPRLSQVTPGQRIQRRATTIFPIIGILDDHALRIVAPGQLAQIRFDAATDIFCGNNRRQRRIHALREKPFVNDHLDAFFNAAVDAGIALSAFVIAAEAEDLGVCPISAVRNHSAKLSQLLKLPDHVFPVAGLAVGYPAEAPKVSMRLPLSVTVHRNAYQENGLDEAIAAYDRRREEAQPYAAQRGVKKFGLAETYGWSEDKARQYAQPERADFGAYVRRIGFKLD